MELLNGLDLATASFVLLATFGAVSAVSFWKKDLTTQQKFLLSICFAFIFGFIPADLGNIVATKAKDAIAVGVTLNGVYQFVTKVATKISS